ncbi:5'-deoxynucleotidase HDDC2-like isoform X2 [Dysidea avara]|uniref:5'-deoxynucleotidase HDDC2-like isoform X2 n=1 Tax=Dysidea avara TaxID=196820 RepID=UPI00332C8F95
MAAKTNCDNLFSYFQLCGKLKHLPRTGWVLRGVPQPENVAGHMYRMAMMSLLFTSNDGVDRDKCMRMCLAHDLAESIVGDITPSDGIPKEEKYSREKVGQEITALWVEYEEGSTPEAMLVKDLDRFDMILQAHEYESEHQQLQLQEFFDSTKGKFQTDTVKKWVEHLQTIRNK